MAAALARYLGLAFASADLLFELDADRRVIFSIGAQSGADASGRRLKGQRLSDFMQAADGSDLAVLFNGLKPGERRGPVRARFQVTDGTARNANLSVFALPELQPNVSCSLAFVADTAVEAAPAAAAVDPAAFRAQLRDQLSLAASRGRELSLVLVEIKGLIEARKKLSAAEMSVLIKKIGTLITEHAPDSTATGLSDERFAILHDASKEPSGLVDALGALGALSPQEGSPFAAVGQSVKLSPERDPLQQFRAVRSALDCFLSAGLPKDEQSLRRSFQAVLDETARSAGRLGTILDERRFDLFFQPVVDLATEAATHHEVLVRFDKGAGPAPLIKLAEDLALIERLDSLVAEQAVRRLRAPGAENLRLAINVSGVSLLNDGFLERLLTSTNTSSALRKRLQLEITESATLQDLSAASRRIRALRESGFDVAIDDFGAGAASFEYLRALPVTSVKIDGRYVRGVDRDERAQAIIKHLVGLCGELKFTTVAEMVEREEELATVAALGVNRGQGWLFGRPEPAPCMPQRRAQTRAKRVGLG
jgi:EAL domain-containing protein (putative c-di-GMP-specific phosphodiesterase class I)